MTKLADGYPIRRQLADAIDEALAKMLGGQISVDVSAARAISSALREGERLRGALESNTVTQTMKEMVETFWERCGEHFQKGDAKDGLLAVLDKHVGPMLAEAWLSGHGCTAAHTASPEEYAARTLAAIRAALEE